MSPSKKTDELALALGGLSRRSFGWLTFALALGLIGLVWLLGAIGYQFANRVASPGGQFSEGLLGTPRFVNPLLAVSDADRDLTALVYSGLMRVDERGELQPDLAESYQISPDGLTYTFTLKNNLTWHDGAPLTADDVEFTVLAAEDPLVKSVKRASWDGVKVERVDARTVRFHLERAYPNFLDNATMGLLPKHIWGALDRDTFGLNQFNTESIGSGPYQIKKITKNNLGQPEDYDLVPFRHFALGAAKISDLRLRFYQNEEALLAAYGRGEITAAGAISAANAKKLEQSGARILRAPLPRVFGVFFNQSRAPVLANQAVRAALGLVINRQQIIDQALDGYGQPADNPLPLSPLPAATSTNTSATSTPDVFATAKQLLTKQGWVWDQVAKIWQKKTKKETTTLKFSLATSNTPELKRAAELIRDAWQQLGVPVELKVYELGDLNQNVIRPRQYDALFFGEIVGRNPDLFAFWHSSQRLDPGLNVALYTNVKADKLLEQARAETDEAKAAEDYQTVSALIAADQPASFVYSPDFLYLLPPTLSPITLPPLNTGAERFANIYHWYLETDQVWPPFVNSQNKLN